MKFCYNTSFTLPKQFQRFEFVSEGKKTLSYNRRNTVGFGRKSIDFPNLKFVTVISTA